MDDLPVAARPLPSRTTLTLLVGRVTTIKLGYWAALTLAEAFLPHRAELSYAAFGVCSAVALAWARTSARAIDRRAGGLYRTVPTIATAFVAASVVASPASLPLLLLARGRSLEGCVPAGTTCAFAPLVLWVAVLVVGMVLVPAAFAASMRPLRSRP